MKAGELCSEQQYCLLDADMDGIKGAPVLDKSDWSAMAGERLAVEALD